MKITKKELIKVINENLEKVFSNSALLNKIKNEDFANLVLKQISILDKLEKSEKIKDKKANDWLKKLNELNASSYKIEKITESKVEELFDQTNYIKVYTKNVFKLDFDNPVEEVVKAETIDIPENNRNNDSFNQGSTFDFMSSAMASMSPEMMKDTWYKQMAKVKLIEEVKSGKFYQFKTKPKIIPILKIFIMSFLSLLIILFLTKLILGIVIGPFSIGSTEKEKTSFVADYGFIEPIVILMIIYALYSLIMQTKNENTKFFFVWRSSIFIGFIWIVYLSMSIYHTIQIFNGKDYWKNDLNNKLIEANVYISFVIYGIIGTIFIFSIITSLYNPKFDQERYNKKLDILYTEIKNSEVKKGI